MPTALDKSINPDAAPVEEMVTFCGGTCAKSMCRKLAFVNIVSTTIDITIGTLLYNVAMNEEYEEILSFAGSTALMCMAYACWCCPGANIMYLSSLYLTWQMREAQPMTWCGWTGWTMMIFVGFVVLFAPIAFILFLVSASEIINDVDQLALFAVTCVNLLHWVYLVYYSHGQYGFFKAQMDDYIKMQQEGRVAPAMVMDTSGNLSVLTTDWHQNQFVAFGLLTALLLMIIALPASTMTVSWYLNDYYGIPVEIVDMSVPDLNLTLWDIFFAETLPGLLMLLFAFILPCLRCIGLLASLFSSDVTKKIYYYEFTERFAKWTMHDCACIALWMMYGSFDTYEIFGGHVYVGFWAWTISVNLFWTAYYCMVMPSGYNDNGAVSSGQDTANADRNTKIGLALTVVALLLLTPAWSLSLAHYDTVFFGIEETESYSILYSIWYMWTDPDDLANWTGQLIAVMIVLYSILIPVVKMILLVLVFTPQFQCIPWIRDNRYAIFNFVRTIGKWSVTDPLCAAFYNGFYQYDGDGNIQLDCGVEWAWALFMTYVIVSLGALQLFPDPPRPDQPSATLQPGAPPSSVGYEPCAVIKESV